MLRRQKAKGKRQKAKVGTPGTFAFCLLPFAFCLLPPVSLGCALGPEQDPGCRSNADCDPGFTCRAGACFDTTTPRSPPADAGDGEDGG
jgi:hypothetical protein